jgi:uncharacterized protein YhaN
MRVRRLQISSFGYIEERDFGDLPPGLVIIHGDNEAGKSTLFSLLFALLYGFHPVGEFPYRPWHKNAYPEFRAEAELDDGSKIEVHRKLMSSPRATLISNGSGRELGNRDLPFVGHVSKELYRALYAPRQSDLQSLEKAQWREIEDYLLGGLGAQVLRPTREAIGELEREAASLWRPNRRGSPRYRQLQEDMNKAAGERRKAIERDKEVREKAVRLEEVNQQIRELTEENAQLSAYMRRIEELLPIRKRLRQIEEWQSRIDNPEPLSRLPEGIPAEFRRLAQSLKNSRERVNGLEDDREKLVRKRDTFTEEDRSILAHSDAIKGWLRRIAAHLNERRAIDDLLRKGDKKALLLEKTSESVLSKPWGEGYYETLDTLVLPDLKAAISTFQERQKEFDNRRNTALGLGTIRVAGSFPRWVPLLLAGTGCALLLLWPIVSHDLLLFLGVTMILLGLVSWAFNLDISRRAGLLERQQERERNRLEELVRRAGQERDRARKRVADTLKGLPVAESLLENPDLSLYQSIASLRTHSAESRQLRKEHDEREEVWKREEAKLQSLLRELGIDPGEPGAIDLAEGRLKEATGRRSAMEDAAGRIGEIDEILPEERRKLAEEEEELERFMELLKDAVSQDLPVEDLIRIASDLQRVAGQIRNAREELEKEHPDLPELIREIEDIERGADEAWSFDPVEIERRRARRGEVEKALGDLRKESGRLEGEIESARGSVSAGELDGRVEEIRDEMEDVCRRHDRLALLAGILREADRLFREEHQPDVLRRAGDYLCRITAGRYRALISMADEDGTERLAVTTGEDDTHWVAPPLSGGTLDQIYLSFRLAVTDHLDQGHEALPLLLDEALINWDDRRLERSGEILKQMESRRQVFFFTCHRWMAERLAEVTGVEALELPDH